MYALGNKEKKSEEPDIWRDGQNTQQGGEARGTRAVRD